MSNKIETNSTGLSTIYITIKECRESLPCINLPKSRRAPVLAPHKVTRPIQSAQDRVGSSTTSAEIRHFRSYLYIFWPKKERFSPNMIDLLYSACPITSISKIRTKIVKKSPPLLAFLNKNLDIFDFAKI